MEATRSRRSKRVPSRVCCNSNVTCRRDWADLGDGPAGLIADSVLAHDVVDYLRFRAVCRSWRRCSTEPSAHGSLDRRFHPRQWIMLREPLAKPNRYRFLNTSTSECIQVDLPELHDHEVLSLTCEGLLVLLHNRNHIRLLNPFTRRLTELPPLTTMLPPEWGDYLLTGDHFGTDFPAWGSGVLNDDLTVVLCFTMLGMLGVAKPGDACWRLLESTPRLSMTSSMFAGRFYCVTGDGVMVFEDRHSCLVQAAKLPRDVCSVTYSLHLVDNAGELMLVHRRFSRHGDRKKRRYDAYRVDTDAGTLHRVKSLSARGHALFIGMYWCLSVPIKAFPPGAIRGDTIYLSFDISERKQTEGYHLANGSIIKSYALDHHPVAQPHTLVDCLSLCTIGKIYKNYI